jgi:hypothetical protein
MYVQELWYFGESTEKPAVEEYGVFLGVSGEKATATASMLMAQESLFVYPTALAGFCLSQYSSMICLT